QRFCSLRVSARRPRRVSDCVRCSAFRRDFAAARKASTSLGSRSRAPIQRVSSSSNFFFSIRAFASSRNPNVQTPGAANWSRTLYGMERPRACPRPGALRESRNSAAKLDERLEDVERELLAVDDVAEVMQRRAALLHVIDR